MSERIRIEYGATGALLYVILIRKDNAKVWNGTINTTYVLADFPDYTLDVAELGGAGSGAKIWDAAVPATLPRGVYDVIAYSKQGGSPVLLDDPLAANAILDWPGASTVEVGEPLGQMTGSEFYAYLLRSGLVRTDLETECYDAITDTVMEIEQLMDFGEREVERVSTDTIDALGEYKLDYESDFGFLAGVNLLDGNFSRALIPISKAEFDSLYPDPGLTYRLAPPVHYCPFAGQILLGPAPDMTTYEYRFQFTARITAAIAAGTAVPFTAQYREVVKDGSLKRVFGNLDNPRREEKFDASYQRGLVRITRKEIRDRDSGANVEYQGV